MAIIKRHPRFIDLTGLRFGKLVIQQESTVHGNYGQLRWECICDCGNKHVTSGESIRSGKSTSCGCNRKKSPPNKNKDRQFAIWKQLYNSTIQKRNKKWNIKGDITLEDFIALSKSPCYYCGLEGSNASQDRGGRNRNKLISDLVIKFNGLDRSDSSKGYWKDNVVPCCKYCNMAKNTMSESDFMLFIQRVHNHLKTNHRI